MQSKAASVEDYLAELPAARKKELSAVRSAVKKHLPKGYTETMQYGMISYVVPLSVYPEGYLNNPAQPLPYISLAAQKNYFALYLMNVSGNAELEGRFRAAYTKSGKKLDMGKSCVRFQSAADLALDVIGATVASTSVDDYIARYEQVRGRKSAAKPARRSKARRIRK
ncbi:MAG TPA: DUF1801 domain-containing protein [Polyangiaceae bacterium]